MAHLHAVSALHDPKVLDLFDCHVLVIIQGVGLSQDLHAITSEDRPGQHAAKHVEGVAVRPMVLLHHVQHQVACGIHLLHVLRYCAVLIPRVQLLDLRLCGLLGSRDVSHHHVDECGQTSSGAKVLQEYLADQLFRVQLVVALVEVNAHLSEGLGEILLLLAQAVSEDLVDGLQHELHEGSRLLGVGGGLCELAGVRVVVQVSPETLGEGEMVKTEAMGFRVDRGIGLQGEHHSELSRTEEDIAPDGREVNAVVHFCTHRVIELLHGLIDVFDAVPQLVIGVCRRELQLHD
mmetsp:Transcript_67413/g.160807  ORF Transcript_67413/g.160807 Transcript_67413/m.160807 type:complete len:291 (-) Transcript_67413:835-1707(-)